MQLIVPYAAVHSDAALSALRQLALPDLQSCLKRLTAQPIERGEALSLTPPHERELARALGLGLTDGQIPWAALHARSRLTQPPAESASWAFITLCHWQVHNGHAWLRELPLQEISPAESDALLSAMRGYFLPDGITLLADQPGRFLAYGAVFAGLATASPERVLGRDPTPWLPSACATLRRLHNEMQMLLYQHPLHEERLARAATPVNSFWISGTGALPTGYGLPAASAQPTLLDTLRPAALAQDWPAWAQAWQALEQQIKCLADTAARQRKTFKLTLCSERHAQCWCTQALPIWQKLAKRFDASPAAQRLAQLA